MRNVLLLLAVVGSAPAAAQQRDSIRSLGEALGAARAASDAGDWKTARAALESALTFSPDNPAVLYNLARAAARAGDRAAAVRHLDRLARQGAVRDVQEDTAFVSLRSSRGFRRAAERIAAAAAPIARSDTAFVLPDSDFIPEGIAWDPADGAYYVGSLNGRGIVRVSGDSVTPWIRPDSTRRVMILGLRVDQPRRRLWLASFVPDSAAPRFLRGVGGWAALEAYQLPTGRLLGRWLPDSSGPHLLNDIAITPAGDVYVTDSEGSALHRLAGGDGQLRRVHYDPAGFIYPNGTALSADGTRLYVAHWEGLSRFELGPAGDPAPKRVLAAPGISTSGIDGLYACGSGLLAVQYLLDFPQITHFVLSGDGRSVADAHPLERRHPAQTGPTTGARSAGHFSYIANAQLERLAPDHSVGAGSGEHSVVLRLSLGDACSG
jgi:sugar lactone lactonase YvrE